MEQPSSKGIFAAPSSHGLALRRRNRLAAKAKLDAFADLLADGYEPGAAAVMLGHLPDYGRVLLQRICRQLGWQAQ